MTATVELLQALFQSPEFARQTTLIEGGRIFRTDYGGRRYYQNEAGETCLSVTSFTSAVLPESRFLTDWRMQKAAEFGSADAANEFVRATADYGTALHIAVADFVRNGGMDWQEFEIWADEHLSAAGFHDDKTRRAAVRELIKDFASMAQFLHDYRCTVLAVELPVLSPALGLATQIDLVVEMDAKDYDKTPVEKRQRHKAIINLKSGKKGFFEAHQYQLLAERALFNATYGVLSGQIEEIYNLAPSDWRTEPSYKLARQTEAVVKGGQADLFPMYLDLARRRGILSAPSTPRPVFRGKTALGESPAAALSFPSIRELVAEAAAQDV